MSKAWAKGSTRAWRIVRARVLARDQYQCQLKTPICTGRATQAHHVLGRGTTGDDEAWLQAACQPCNASVGDPTTARQPAPRPLTQW